MGIAQRYSSSTSHPAYGADRWRWGFGNHSAGTVTASQQSLSSSDTGPWEKGFRNYTRLALGQAGTAAANTYISMRYKVEAQDIANSGWDYTSASSDITISFWFRCSTNQTFYFEVKSDDGTAQSYVFSFTASGNNTWTKVTKTIPGNSNIQINNDNGSGLSLWIYQFYGTDYSNNKTLDQWAAYSGSNIMPDMASTWLTAGASTWDLTGVQLEVGSVATDFEHRPFATERRLCQRYYQKYTNPKLRGVLGNSTDFQRMGMPLLVEMRAAPSATWSGTQSVYDGVGTASITGMSAVYVDPANIEFDSSVSGSLSSGGGSAVIAYTGGNEATLMLNAEL